MIYTCKHCTAWFSAGAIREAIEKKQNIIICKYCGQVTEFSDMRSSHIARGYDYLSIAEFYSAYAEFSAAIDDSKRHGHTPSPDAQIGFALAQFQVHTVFSDNDPDKLSAPKLICHRRNEMDFADAENYLSALSSNDGNAGAEIRNAESEKFRGYADYIDTLKKNYDEIVKSKPRDFAYGAFIAYEDEPENGADNRGYEFANKVRNILPDGIKHVFLPDIDEFDGDKMRYEAEILYAIDNSNCMLVIADNDIDFRLTTIYSRYYRSGDGDHKKRLGFIRYLNKITINLPDPQHQIAQNVFEIDEKDRFIRFACSNNNIYCAPSAYGEEEKVAENVIFKPISGEKPNPDYNTDDLSNAYESISSNQFVFGSYPQDRETSATVENFFAMFAKPEEGDAHGWNVLFTNKNGVPYTWYRDEVIEGCKYRGVIFNRPRDVYSVQPSDARPNSQRKSGYMPRRVYCFKFKPIVWDKVSLSNDNAVLVANQGIDSMEYDNSQNCSNEWENSTVREWLNNDFKNTAFSASQQSRLWSLSGFSDNEKVFLLDCGSPFDRERLKKGKRIIVGSDYMRCIGGTCNNRTVNSYWVKSDLYGTEENKASIVYTASESNISSQYVDNTGVAVVPKIIMKL